MNYFYVICQHFCPSLNIPNSIYKCLLRIHTKMKTTTPRILFLRYLNPQFRRTYMQFRKFILFLSFAFLTSNTTHIWFYSFSTYLLLGAFTLHITELVEITKKLLFILQWSTNFLLTYMASSTLSTKAMISQCCWSPSTLNKRSCSFSFFLLNIDIDIYNK